MKPIQQKKAPKVQGKGKAARPPKYKKGVVSLADKNSRGEEYSVTRAMINEQNGYSVQYVQPNQGQAMLFIETGIDIFREAAELYVKGLKLIMPLMRLGFNDPAERYENLPACKQAEALYKQHQLEIQLIEARI